MPTRTRTMTALFCGAALMNAAMAVASAVSTIVASDRLGVRWAAVPNTAGVVGTGIGALALTRLMGRRGRRAGLTCGYLASACGAAVAVAAVAGDSVAALTAGLLLLGLGNAGAQLSRYAAAELYPADRRGAAIGTVVWAGAVGAVGGPLLLDASSEAATGLGWAALTGPYVFAALTTLAAALTIGGGSSAGTTGRTRAGASGDARAEASSGAAVASGGAAEVGPVRTGAGPVRTEVGPVRTGAGVSGGAAGVGSVRLRALVRVPAARTALVVMVTAQVVMVAVMTATPLDMHMHGQGLGAVGLTLSAHTLGMFALSPLTGRMVDGVGARPVMAAGLLALVSATVLAASVPESDAPVRTGALFLLGYGWNLCFVGGSGTLASDLPDAARASVEGAVDAAVWGIAAVASLASTVTMAAGGYAALALAAGALVLVPGTLLFRAS
ncbi:MAG: MFS transporter [Actinoallomurus sp.]